MMRSNRKTVVGLASIGVLALVSFAITGCGASNSMSNSTSKSTSNQSMSMPMNSSTSQRPMAKVKMTIPKQTAVGKGNQFSVLVMQQGKPIPAKQVEEVMFQIWPNGSQPTTNELVHAQRTGDGIYSIQYSFKSAGTYDVMYHVTANGMMIMTGPQKIVVTK